MGSNMAENHPVGFRWVMEAQGARREGHPRRPALHAHERDGDEARRHPRRQRHRLPRRHRQLHPRERPLLPRVRRALHERAGDHRRGLRGHRGPRRPLLRLGSREQAATTSRRWRYEGMEVHGAGRRARARASRRRRASSRATAAAAAGSSTASRRRRIRTLAASALRLPDPEAPLRALHAGDRRRDVRLLGRGLPRGRRDARARTPAASGRARSATRSAGRSTRSACRTSAPPRSSSCCSATSAGPAAASWRCAATRRSRARPTSRRSTTSCPATCRCRTREAYGDLDALHRGEHVADRLVGQLRVVLGQPAEGLLRRARDGGERLLLRLRCRAIDERQLRLLDASRQMLDGQGQGLHHRRREPGRRPRERQGAPARRSRSSTGSSCATSSRSSRRRSGTTAPRSSRAS